MEKSAFFQNTGCEHFPCHETGNPENFNCLFCFCPLYALGAECGGSFCYTEEGIKDCSGCLIPHRRENYALILEKMGRVIEMTRKNPRENP